MPTDLRSDDELQDRLQAALGDAYVIEKELAPGGMSRLFLATEASLERKVVIKLLPPETASEVSAARFQREVLLAAHLQHPHILPVLSTGSTREGIFYYIMPYVAGESLRHRLERERIPIGEAVRIVREIADALAMAHDRGIVHRDIKPANILLQEGHAVVTDFGIARAVEAAREGASDRLTQTGVGIGTLGYMAPEQLAGERDLDTRADVYALAVVGYEILSGKPPFSRPTAQALVAAHLTEPPPPLSSVAPEVPHELGAVISKALSKSPDDRYRTAAEFRDALDLRMTQAFAAIGEPRLAISRRLAIGIGVALTLVIAAAGYFFTRAPKLDSNYVVVLPFNLRGLSGADTSFKQGLVDLLYDGLNSQGWVKVVAPSRYLRTFNEKADDGTASKLGQAMGAGIALYGTVEAVGADSVAVKMTLRDVKRGHQIGADMSARGAKKDLVSLGKVLRKAVLNELSRLRPIAAFRNTWLDEANPSALQAFLIAEQFYRRSAWDSAMAYYTRAIDADSAFALAYYHAARVIGWRISEDDSTAHAYLHTAARFNRGLPPRDSLLISADSVRAGLAADTGYFGSVRHLFATLRMARDSFPSDSEVWWALGDAYFHYASGPGMSVVDDTILAAFDRSIQLDSGFTPAYIHAIELRLSRDGADTGLRYAKAYLALQPTDYQADAIRVLTGLMQEGGINDRSAKILDTLSADALQTVWLIARRWADSAQTGVRLLQFPMTGRRGAGFILDPGIRRVLLVRELAYRGRLTEAYNTLGTNIGPLESESFGVLASLGAIPHDTAAAVFARWLQDPAMWVGSALSWWAAQRDTTSLLAAAARAEAELPKAASPPRRRDWTYRVAATRAYLALGRRSSDVLSRFEELPDTLCFACALDRFIKARLLDSLGRHEAAERVLLERPYLLLSTVEVPLAWNRAMIAERLQHYATAARAYTLVARAWGAGDPSQRTVATQATAKAGQLGGDQRRPATLARADR